MNTNRRLVVTTVAAPELLGVDLLSLLPDEQQHIWLRHGDGLVGFGQSALITTHGAERFPDAQGQWDALVAHAQVTDQVQAPGTGLVAFGSVAFSPHSAEETVLIVPQVILGRRGENAWITTISPDAAGPAPQQVLADLIAATHEPPSPGRTVTARGTLSRQEWTAVVGSGIGQIKAGALDKVVLARDLTVRAEHAIDPRWLTARLAADYGACWTFHVAGMVGATPELLIRRDRGLALSRVLAGTIARTGNDEADLGRAALLAHSSKDLEEHEYAAASVATALAPHCSSLNVPETPFVLHLPNVLHLATDITGVLSPDAGPIPSSLMLARDLHPTAAVCGTPTALAAALIEEIEGMDRGRYAAPVGWMDADGDGEWGLALRSAHIDPADPREIRLFAGCGIVGSSNPATELAESEAKMRPVLDALGV